VPCGKRMPLSCIGGSGTENAVQDSCRDACLSRIPDVSGFASTNRVQNRRCLMTIGSNGDVTSQQVKVGFTPTGSPFAFAIEAILGDEWTDGCALIVRRVPISTPEPARRAGIAQSDRSYPSAYASTDQNAAIQVTQDFGGNDSWSGAGPQCTMVVNVAALTPGGETACWALGVT